MQLSNMSDTCKVLCVDDDTYLLELLEFALSREGYRVFTADSGVRALQLAQVERPDIVLLDLSLPDLDGLSLCSQFRNTYRLPVIMLSARSSDQDVVAGFGEGADDFITKPFTMRILIYRLRAVLRRSYPMGLAASVPVGRFKVGNGYFSIENYELVGDLGAVRLTQTEGRILHLLIANEGRGLPAERIMDQLWKYDSDSSIAVIKTHIRRLRAKMAQALGDERLVRTIPGVGYSFQQYPLHLDPTREKSPEPVHS